MAIGMVTDSQEPEFYEPQRECGDRQVGKLYLVGEGTGYICPSLPKTFKPCECCDYDPPQYRDFQWIKKAYIRHLHEPTGQPCDPRCPICYPGTNSQNRYGLMWVGKKFYSPETFLDELKEMGISKAIKQIPKGLVPGETWVLLAHPQAYIDRSDDKYVQKYNDWQNKEFRKRMDEKKSPEPQPPAYPGVFSAFIPSRVEMPIYESQATPEYLAQLEEKGITPVIIPDKFTAHRTRHRRVRTRKNIAKMEAEG